MASRVERTSTDTVPRRPGTASDAAAPRAGPTLPDTVSAIVLRRPLGLHRAEGTVPDPDGMVRAA